MNRSNRALLVGMVYGDGSLNVRNRLQSGKYKYVSSELQIAHGVRQLAYLEYKSEILRRIFGGNHSVRTYLTGVLKNTGKRYKQYKLTKSNKYFRVLKRMLYPGGVKTFTVQGLKMLTPAGIALWYMDDGSARINRNKDGYVSSVATDISTQCSSDEVDVIIDYFQSEHGIRFKKRYDKKCAEKSAYFIQANTSESKKFVALVRPFIIPSMLYKIKHVADLQTHERPAPSGQCKVCQVDIYDNRRKGLCSMHYSRQLTKGDEIV